MFAMGILIIYVMICIIPTAVLITGYVWQKERGRIFGALWTLTNSLYGGILLLIISFIGYVYNASFFGVLSFFLVIGGIISFGEHWRKKKIN
ncbi:hypothetical protein [Bacillus arachidis]|uniref:hypothetical protein n=1 Tax=Bacillus arachidis TaxID=2819290 RepID=UPI00255C70D3|nr:hypothetical protein [Bacillus arachidis]WIY61624.1 hypothetical protein QRY57_03360 [Bacillus arachidis]